MSADTIRQGTLWGWFLLLGLTAGCFDRPIYTQTADASAIGHPPSAVWVRGELPLNTGFARREDAPVVIETLRHCAKCSSPQARALGSDFDGYVRVTVSQNGRLIARAQQDYKGEPGNNTAQTVYDKLMRELEWTPE